MVAACMQIFEVRRQVVVHASTTLCGRPLLPAHRDLGPHRAGVHSGGSAVRPWTLAPSTRTAGCTFSLVRKVSLCHHRMVEETRFGMSDIIPLRLHY